MLYNLHVTSLPLLIRWLQLALSFVSSGSRSQNKTGYSAYQPQKLYSQDLTVKSPLSLLHISLQLSCKNLVLDRDKNLHVISLNILTTCLLDNVWIL